MLFDPFSFCKWVNWGYKWLDQGLRVCSGTEGRVTLNGFISLSPEVFFWLLTFQWANFWNKHILKYRIHYCFLQSSPLTPLLPIMFRCFMAYTELSVSSFTEKMTWKDTKETFLHPPKQEPYQSTELCIFLHSAVFFFFWPYNDSFLLK